MSVGVSQIRAHQHLQRIAFAGELQNVIDNIRIVRYT